MKIIISDTSHGHDSDRITNLGHVIKVGQRLVVNTIEYTCTSITCKKGLGYILELKLEKDRMAPAPGLPKFVMLGDVALRWSISRDMYWRDGGKWGVGWNMKRGNIYSVSIDKHLNNIHLTPTTEDVWRESNGRYARYAEMEEEI